MMPTVPVGIQSWHLPNASPECCGYTRLVGICVFNPLKPSGHYMNRQFNIQPFHVQRPLYLFVLCGSQNKQPLFPYTALTDWFV